MTDAQLKARFQELFQAQPVLYQAPGRVNLIGEHTDFNGGFVLPAAIEFVTRAAISPRHDRKLVVISVNYQEQVEISLDALPPVRCGHWSDYIVGVLRQLALAGYSPGGTNLLLQGNIPPGAGLSSSASLEVVTAFALLDQMGLAIDLKQLALLCQQAENEFVGARCGVMDQFISSHGRAHTALLLDCRSLEFRYLPLPEAVRLVICNTLVKHSIAGGEYNLRRAECEEAVGLLQKRLPALHSLREVTEQDLTAHRDLLPEQIWRRCRHVVSENERVLQAAKALEQNDLSTFGKLMQESHRSLRDDFAVSCAELDLLVRIAAGAPGVYGSRMTGGGFGGCTINLVKAEFVAQFKQQVGAEFGRAFNYEPEVYVCSAVGGVGPV